MLENGSQLPSIAARNLDGDAVELAAATSGTWSVILFYRGHW